MSPTTMPFQHLVDQVTDGALSTLIHLCHFNGLIPFIFPIVKHGLPVRNGMRLVFMGINSAGRVAYFESVWIYRIDPIFLSELEHLCPTPPIVVDGEGLDNTRN